MSRLRPNICLTLHWLLGSHRLVRSRLADRDVAGGHGRLGLDLRRRERRGGRAAYGVVAFLAIRFAIGSALLGAAAIRQFHRRSLLVGARHRHCAGAGLLLPDARPALHDGTNSGFITGLFVVTTPIINRLLFGVKIRPRFWAAVAVSLVGLYLLTNAGPDTAERRRSAHAGRGDLATACTSRCWIAMRRSIIR